MLPTLPCKPLLIGEFTRTTRSRRLMRGLTRMKMDVDVCDSRFDARMAMKTQAKKHLRSDLGKKTRADHCNHSRTDSYHFLRFPFFFFATVSAAGTVCSGSEKSRTRESSSWILCIVCETLAMIRDFWSSVMSGCFASTCVEIKILRRVRAESSRRPPRHRREACSMA